MFSAVCKVQAAEDKPELFTGWQQPKVLLIFTGFMNGYVEPCGCAGLENMKGGLSRRHTFFKQLAQQNWNYIAIDAGNLNKGFGRQEEMKYTFVIDDALRLMKYGAAGLGNKELLFPTEFLIAYCIDVPGSPKRYTSANTAILQFATDCVAPFRVLEENGVKIGVVSVTSGALFKEINNPELLFEDPVKKITETLPLLEAEKCTKTVLILHCGIEETKKILSTFPGKFNFAVVSDTPAEPPLKPNFADGTMLIEVGEKGKFAVAVGLFDNPTEPLRYERVPLDSRFENSKEIFALMKIYQKQLMETGLDGLGVKPMQDRRFDAAGAFAGTNSCKDCHEPSYQIWRKSKHGEAWKSLCEVSKPPRNFDPECIACHVVGWNPKEFLPYQTGFLSEEKTPHLINVGCESCHGPCGNHVKAESGKDENLKITLRKEARLSLEGNIAKKTCINCHDGDNSPHFDFDTYWKKIIHKESD